jgi:hypothetical protein
MACKATETKEKDKNSNHNKSHEVDYNMNSYTMNESDVCREVRDVLPAGLFLFIYYFTRR